jgi:hypothetical protein
MLPGWDRLQDLRAGRKVDQPDPIPVATVPPPETPVEAKLIVDPGVLDATTDRIVAKRVMTDIARNERMSLLGKLAHLTEEAQDFHRETEQDLDGISEKIALGREKRKAAVEKHHGYYDAIIAGVDESTKVIDRLSNGPLHGDGENS